MNNHRTSFEEVADWCEKHLEEKRGREIGMIFGAVLRTYGRLATLPARPSGDERAAKERQLDAKAEELLFDFSTRFFVAYKSSKPRIVEPMSMRTNMTYDTGPPPQE